MRKLNFLHERIRRILSLRYGSKNVIKTFVKSFGKVNHIKSLLFIHLYPRIINQLAGRMQINYALEKEA